MLPILHRILEEKEVQRSLMLGLLFMPQQKQASQAFVRALVLVPTRELCEQVKTVVASLMYE